MLVPVVLEVLKNEWKSCFFIVVVLFCKLLLFHPDWRALMAVMAHSFLNYPSACKVAIQTAKGMLISGDKLRKLYTMTSIWTPF